MLADLDLLLIAVFCTADDLLPEPAKNARRILTDAEVVTLAVAQAIMGITSDARFIRVARKQLAHLFPKLPDRSGYLKRREALSDTICAGLLLPAGVPAPKVAAILRHADTRVTLTVYAGLVESQRAEPRDDLEAALGGGNR